MPPKKDFKHAKPPCKIDVISPLPELARGSLALRLVEMTGWGLTDAQKEEIFAKMVKAWAEQAKNSPKP